MGHVEVDHANVSFVVPFVKGKARPRFGKGRAYVLPEERANERLVWVAYCDACDGVPKCAPERVPVTVTIRAYGTMPASRPKRCGDTEPYVYTPDLDNIEKLVIDALNPRYSLDGAKVRHLVKPGAWVDDRQITQIDSMKVERRRGEHERTEVRVVW